MVDIIHKKLSYDVNACIFDVHNAIGPGVREECYQKALEIRLAEASLACEAKPYTRSALIHRGEVADVFEPDLIVADQLILEAKSQPAGLKPVHLMQTLNYVKFKDLSLGMLVNFAEARAVIRRIPYHSRKVIPDEDYELVRPLITPALKEPLRLIRHSLHAIQRSFGVGYWDSTYRSLAAIEFRYNGLDCTTNLEVVPRLGAKQLPSSHITPLQIGSDILVQVDALRERITARAIRTMQSHLKLTGARIGIVVNFGKDHFEIRGVRPLKK